MLRNSKRNSDESLTLLKWYAHRGIGDQNTQHTSHSLTCPFPISSLCFVCTTHAQYLLTHTRSRLGIHVDMSNVWRVCLASCVDSLSVGVYVFVIACVGRVSVYVLLHPLRHSSSPSYLNLIVPTSPYKCQITLYMYWTVVAEILLLFSSAFSSSLLILIELKSFVGGKSIYDVSERNLCRPGNHQSGTVDILCILHCNRHTEMYVQGYAIQRKNFE